MQETFIKVFRTLKQFKGTGNIGAWIRRIAVNTAIERWRKMKREKQHYETIDMEVLTEIHPSENFDPMEMDDLLRVIQSLPIGYRTIFNLYAIEGYKHREIAEKLKIKEGTSKSQYARARNILIKTIENENKIARTGDNSHHGGVHFKSHQISNVSPLTRTIKINGQWMD